MVSMTSCGEVPLLQSADMTKFIPSVTTVVSAGLNTVLPLLEFAADSSQEAEARGRAHATTKHTSNSAALKKLGIPT